MKERQYIRWPRTDPILIIGSYSGPERERYLILSTRWMRLALQAERRQNGTHKATLRLAAGHWRPWLKVRVG